MRKIEGGGQGLKTEEAGAVGGLRLGDFGEVYWNIG